MMVGRNEELQISIVSRQTQGEISNKGLPNTPSAQQLLTNLSIVEVADEATAED